MSRDTSATELAHRRFNASLRYWLNFLPPAVAGQQVAWERREAIMRLRDQHGMTYREIGKTMGCTAANVRELEMKGRRRRGHIPPAQRFLAESSVRVGLHELLMKAKRNRSQKLRFIEMLANGECYHDPQKRDWMRI